MMVSAMAVMCGTAGAIAGTDADMLTPFLQLCGPEAIDAVPAGLAGQTSRFDGSRHRCDVM
jgi:hypothetical protein